MAKIYKFLFYLVDPNEYYGDVEDLFRQMINKTEVFCPVPIQCQECSFEWDDELPINYIGCKAEDCEKYFESKEE